MSPAGHDGRHGHHGRHGRLSAGIYGGVAVALVVAVVAVAYGAQPPALGVAEFAPAAQQQLEAPPSTQSEQSSAALRGRRGTSSTASTTTTSSSTTGAGADLAPTTRVARTRSCTGQPPRQTEDPQSPPCVATIFEGDNGGATAKGVTATDIKVAAPIDLSGSMAEPMALLVDYFNQRYEFYGRRLQLVATTSSIPSDPAGQRAAGEEIASLAPFASLDIRMSITTPAASLYHSLARNGVIAITGRDTPYSDEVVFDELHPYVWSVNPSLEVVWQAVGELACTALVGQPARHGGADVASTTRKFGVIVEREYTPGLPMFYAPSKLLGELDACGVTPEVAQVSTLGVDGRTAVAKLKAAGVTSIICACNSGAQNLSSLAADAGGWEPELLLPSMVWSAEATERDLPNSPVNQARHLFGVFPTPKLLPYQVRPFFAAMRQMSSSYEMVNNSDFRALESVYRQLSILAAGVQGAGPTLTPDTFAQALMTMQFPNPGAGQPPYWQSAVGFGPGDHTYYSDVALAWWNPTLPSTTVFATPTSKLGSWCFLGGGARFRPGEIPADADSRFFNPAEPCR